MKLDDPSLRFVNFIAIGCHNQSATEAALVINIVNRGNALSQKILSHEASIDVATPNSIFVTANGKFSVDKLKVAHLVEFVQSLSDFFLGETQGFANASEWSLEGLVESIQESPNETS